MEGDGGRRRERGDKGLNCLDEGLVLFRFNLFLDDINCVEAICYDIDRSRVGREVGGEPSERLAYGREFSSVVGHAGGSEKSWMRLV